MEDIKIDNQKLRAYTCDKIQQALQGVLKSCSCKEFLALTGAQGATLSVRLSICSFGDKLSISVNLQISRC